LLQLKDLISENMKIFK